jgi:hypothetical protein
MENQAQKILELINGTIKELPEMNRNKVFDATNTLDSILIRNYDKAVNYKQEVKTIQQNLGILISSNSDTNIMGWNLQEIKGWLEGLLNSIKKEIEFIGLPSSKDVKIDKSVNINVTQNQQQSLNQNIQLFLDSIKNDLTGRQYNELVSVARSEKSPEKAKVKIIQKLEDFGLNVCASIIANIITNPTIWASLG